jgi:hypothetical protein
MPARRLTLKREVLQELSANDLSAVGGAAGPVTTTIVGVGETMYSCLAYISCAFLNTCFAPDTLLCIQD